MVSRSRQGRLVDSKPLNALASSLGYVPLSGRAATEERMVSGMNSALSRSVGQDSDNVVQALRKASDDLGPQFDDVLRNNKVKVDDDFLINLASHADQAEKSLAPMALASSGTRLMRFWPKPITARSMGRPPTTSKRHWTVSASGTRQKRSTRATSSNP